MEKTASTPIQLFRGMTADELAALRAAHCIRVQRYDKNALICHAGRVVHEIGIVQSGSVNVESNDLWGNKSILSHVEAGQAFADFFENIETKLRFLTGFELIRAVRSSDSDCKRVDTRFGRKFVNFVGIGEHSVVGMNFNVILDSCKFAEFRFYGNVSVVSVSDHFFGYLDI